MIQQSIDKEGDLPLNSNIIAAGSLTGTFSFRENEFISAVFALLGA